MQNKLRRTRLLALFIIGCGCRWLAPDAQAALIITRTVADLPDVIVGENLWSASYTLSGNLPVLDQGFTIYFDASLYRNLTGSFAAASNWDVLLIQPDVGLSAPGFLDGLSLVSVPTYTGPFTVNFTWLGSGSPGAQNFEVYTLNGGFSILQSGQVSIGAVNAPEGSDLGGLDAAVLLALLIFATVKNPVRSYFRRYRTAVA